MSQLDLSLETGVSSRHLSFLETGRSVPSRAMVHQLMQHLEVPESARNAMLVAAGLASEFPPRKLTNSESDLVRQAVEWMVAKHDPFPAMALDRNWRIEAVNAAGTLLLSLGGLKKGSNMLDAIADPMGLRSWVSNWEEVSVFLLARMETEIAALGGNATLEVAARALRAESAMEIGDLPVIVPVKIDVPGVSLRLFSTLVQLGSAQEMALVDHRVELYFPADEPTRDWLLELNAHPPPCSM